MTILCERGDTLYHFTKEENARARPMCEKALALDPTYGVAYTLLSWTYLLEWLLYGNPGSPSIVNKLTVSPKKRLLLMTHSPSAHEVLGFIYLFKDRQHEQAIAEVKRALTLGPNWFSSYVALGQILNFSGPARRSHYSGFQLSEET